MLPDSTSLPQNAFIISRWKLNEASGNREDSVGSNTLTDNNTVLSAAGQFGETAADFERSNSESLSITDASQSGLDVGNWSFAVWAKLEQLPSTAGGNMNIASKANATGNQRSWQSYVKSDDKLNVEYAHAGGFDANSTRKNTTSAFFEAGDVGSWVHLAYSVTVASQSIAIYKNGVSVGVTSLFTGSSSVQNGTATFFLGNGEDNGGYFDGLLQDAIIWSVALSGAEVTTLYTAYSTAAAATPAPSVIPSPGPAFSGGAGLQF